MLNISSATPMSASARTSSCAATTPGREGTDGQPGGDVADHRRHAEPMGDGPEDESRAERDEQSELEGHRRLGGMGRDHTGRSRWPTLPPMLGGDTLSVLEIFVVLVAAAHGRGDRRAALTILPYSVGLVVLGVAVSALQPPLDLEIAPDVLLAVLIPGLIFEAAYRIDLRDLMPNLPAITVLATVGVLVTAATVALTLNVATGLPFALAFLVGTMLAATIRRVIAVFSRLRAPRSADDAQSRHHLISLTLFPSAVSARRAAHRLIEARASSTTAPGS